MFLWKLLVCVVVLFAFADCDVGVLTEHGSDGIDPVEHHEGEDKEHSKRTIFDINNGWAKHVKLQGKKKLVLGYSPVDFKYVPVVKPLMRRPTGFRFRPKFQKRPRPVYQVPINSGGWKPLLPAHVPVPSNSAVRPWQHEGWRSTKLIPSKPFRPSPVDHVHNDIHHDIHHDVHNDVHTDHAHHGGHILVQDSHHHHDGHVLVDDHHHHHHHDAHALVHDHHDGHALVHDHHNHHDGHILVHDTHHHVDPHLHNPHLHVVQPNPVVVHYDHPSLHVDKPALPVLPLGATFPLPVLQQPTQHHHLIPQPTAVPVLPEPHGHILPQYPGFYQVQGVTPVHVPQVGITHLHPVPQAHHIDVPQVPHVDIPAPQIPHVDVAIPQFHNSPHIDVPVPQIPLATHLQPLAPVPHLHQLPIPGVNIPAESPHFHQVHNFQHIPQVHHVNQIPQVPQFHHIPQVPHVHQIPQVPHVHQIPQVPHVHQISQVPHVHQIPQVPHTHQFPQVPHFHQIPSPAPPIQIPNINQLPPFETPVNVPNTNQLPPVQTPIFNQSPQEEPRFQHTPQIPQIPQQGYLPSQQQELPQQQNNQIAIEYHGKGAHSIPLEHLFKNIQVSNQYETSGEQYQQLAGYQQDNVEYVQQQQEEQEYEQSNQIFPSGNGLHPGYTDLQLPLHLPQHPNLVSTDPQTFPSGIVQPALALEPPYKK